MDDEIEQQAFDWHDWLKTDDGAATRAAFDAWRAADPRHAEAFEQQHRFAATARVGGWRGEMPAPRPRLVRRNLGYGMAGLATAAVVLMLVVRHDTSTVLDSGPMAATTPALSQARRLADGSLVALTANAVVVPDAAAGGRGARLLRGTARFFVVHDPAHPFRVFANGVTVTARGTIFEVALTPGGARVSLLEGRVEVAASRSAATSAAVVLQPGEALAADDKIPRAMAAAPAPIAWLEVDGMTLGDVITLAARNGGARIALADPALAALRVTGRFDLSKSAGLAAKLAAALDLRLAARGDTLILSRAK